MASLSLLPQAGRVPGSLSRLFRLAARLPASYGFSFSPAAFARNHWLSATSESEPYAIQPPTALSAHAYPPSIPDCEEPDESSVTPYEGDEPLMLMHPSQPLPSAESALAQPVMPVPESRAADPQLAVSAALKLIQPILSEADTSSLGLAHA